jgi:hypothetical protein
MSSDDKPWTPDEAVRKALAQAERVLEASRAECAWLTGELEDVKHDRHIQKLRLVGEKSLAEKERDEALKWDDAPQPEDDAINATFPTRTGKHETYGEAMRLVSARRSKGALVGLVNWLLCQRDEARTMLEKAVQHGHEQGAYYVGVCVDREKQIEKEKARADKAEAELAEERRKREEAEATSLENARLRRALEEIVSTPTPSGHGLPSPGLHVVLAQNALAPRVSFSGPRCPECGERPPCDPRACSRASPEPPAKDPTSRPARSVADVQRFMAELGPLDSTVLASSEPVPPAAEDAANVSRSMAKRVAIQKGEPMPEFDADGFRVCEFCGCRTNARLRECCDRGLDADRESSRRRRKNDDR